MPIQIYWKFYHQKMKIFRWKNSDIFHISAQNIDCEYSLDTPRWGGSNYPQSMFWAEIKKKKKIMYTPANLSFTTWNWGLRGSKLYRRVFVIRGGIRWIFFLSLRESICSGYRENIYCGYLLEASHRGTSNEYPQHMFSYRKISKLFDWKKNVF